MNSEFDTVKGKIPEDLIEAFIEKIVVHEDYYEWRFKRNIGTVQCTVDGNIKKKHLLFINSDSGEQVIGLSDSHEESDFTCLKATKSLCDSSMQHRQRLQISNTHVSNEKRKIIKAHSMLAWSCAFIILRGDYRGRDEGKQNRDTMIDVSYVYPIMM